MNVLRKPSLRWARVMQLGFGLGLIGGAFEFIQIVAMLRLEMSFAEAMKLGVACSLLGGLLAFGLALPVGLVVQLTLRKFLDSVAYAAGMGGTAFLMSGFFLWHAALQLLGDGRPPAALAMAMCPLGIAGVVYLNTGFWGRKEEIGAEFRVGWKGWSAAIALGMIAVFSWQASSKTWGSPDALEGDPNVLLVTIDTLRRDHVSAYGTDHAHTPNMDRLAQEGVLFLDAVTPTPETGPSHASMFTSLHPLRHGVLSNANVLDRGHVTIAERLADEGYATGAFVSSFAVAARSGLDQGFQVYDDDFVPFARGLSQVLVVQYALRGAMATGRPHLVPWALERPGAATVDLSEEWIRQQGDKPWFAWVHLFEPHAPYEGPDQTVNHRELLTDPDHEYTEAEAEELKRLYAYEAGVADALVGRLLETLEASGTADRTLVIITSDHGEQLGEHDIWFHHHGLYDESLRVPLIMRAPGLKSVQTVIPQQVRVMDLSPTILRWVKLNPFEQERTEGLSLFGLPLGIRKKSTVTHLLGRKSASLSEGCLLGVRLPSEMEGEEGKEIRVKYIFHPEDGSEEFYNLSEDPLETDNRVGLHQGAAQIAYGIIKPSILKAGCGEGAERSSWENEALKSLGYME